MPLNLTQQTYPHGGPDEDRPMYANRGISRSLALGRILHFESLMRRRLGEVRAQRYVRLHNYYANQNLPPDNIEQPLLINYVKQIVDKHTGYLFGQYTDRLFDIRVTPYNREDLSEEDMQAATAYGRRIKRFLDHWYEQNSGDVRFYQGAKNGSLYGDTVFKLRYDPVYRMVVIEPVLPEYFHCIWNIANMHELTEVIIAYPIDRSWAKENFGTAGNEQVLGYQEINPNYLPGIGIYWEHWTTSSFRIWIDDHQVVNAPNPYMKVDDQGNLIPGFIPFIHIQNMQCGAEYWGYGDAENVLYLQDELNRRMADAGDITNNHAHPIVTLKNFSGNVLDLHVGPDALWDVGRDGEAKRLEGTGPAPAFMDYIEKVKDIMHDTSAMPSSAFGSQKGGQSHQSGLMLALTMMPVVEHARERRLRWNPAMKKIFKMVFEIMAAYDPEILTRTWQIRLEDIYQYDIAPVFADILPKDRLEQVNESVARSANMLQSIEGALEALGEKDVQGEYNRIKQDAVFKASMGAPQPDASGGTAGKNSEQGQGGSNAIPGGIGASAGKPGTLIKSNELDSANADSVSLSNTI